MDIKEQISNFKHMVNNYKLTYIIISANNIGIFDCLSEESKDLSQISGELQIEENRLEPILNALALYKIVDKNEKGYCFGQYNDVLNKDSKYNQKGYIDFAKNIMKKYLVLENSIKDKNFAINNFKELTENNAEDFMRGMESNAILQAKFIAENYNFDNHNILDIGAGAGTYLITVAKKYNTVKGKMIDLPEIVKIQNKKIEKEQLQERIISEECNYNISFPIEKYDDVFLFAVVHQEPKENLNKLLNNIYNVLKPNGRLFLTSFFLNEDRISPEFSVQFAVEMLMNSNNGKVYTHREIENLIKENNFKEIERIDKIPSPATLYLSRK